MVFTPVQSSSRSTATPIRYPLEVLREEAFTLVRRGILHPSQSIFALCESLPAREWVEVERVLEEGEFLLRDRIGDLIAQMDWYND
jgi:hypothetical protein